MKNMPIKTLVIYFQVLPFLTFLWFADLSMLIGWKLPETYEVWAIPVERAALIALCAVSLQIITRTHVRPFFNVDNLLFLFAGFVYYFHIEVLINFIDIHLETYFFMCMFIVGVCETLFVQQGFMVRNPQLGRKHIVYGSVTMLGFTAAAMVLSLFDIGAVLNFWIPFLFVQTAYNKLPKILLTRMR